MHILRRCVFLVALLVAPSFAWGWEGTVVRVCDGDTIIVEREGASGARERVSVRLYGIDTPEYAGRGWRAQPYCRAAASFLEDLLESGRVAVMDLGVDRYGRTVGGVVSLPDGVIVQEELLKAGLAWVYTKYCRGCRQWRDLEQNAREAGLGLWRENAPVPPWEWRKNARDKARGKARNTPSGTLERAAAP